MAVKRKKKSLDSINQTHAKVEKKFEPTTLDQIWGDDGASEYGTLDYQSYQEKILLVINCLFTLKGTSFSNFASFSPNFASDSI